MLSFLGASLSGHGVQPTGLLAGQIVGSIVGAGQMGHEAGAVLHRRAGAERAVGLGGSFPAKADAMHAGVHLEPAGDRPGQPLGAEQAQLLLAVDDQRQLMLGGGTQLPGLQAAFKHYQRAGEARSAQQQGLGDPRHGERIRTAQGGGDAHQAVTVGVGLDDRHHPAGGGGLADALEVLANCGEVDERPGPEVHQ